MSPAASDDTAKLLQQLLDKTEALQKDVNQIKKGPSRPQMPPLGAFPQALAPTIAGPLLLAWLVSTMIPPVGPGANNPALMETIAQFATCRGELWHQFFATLANIAQQAADGTQSRAPAVPNEDELKKIEEALKAQNIDQTTRDKVRHAVTALALIQQLRDASISGKRE